MNKTVYINLNGISFTVNEDAYHQLERYLNAIKAKFNDKLEAQEIIHDIEARIAELFTQALEGKQIVDLIMVEAVQAQLGSPEDIVGEEVSDNQTTTDQNQRGTSSNYTTGKKLMRDPDNSVLGGVVSGLCAYFGINETTWARLALLLVTIFATGTPIIIYIILWAIVPEAKNASDKLQMRGEPVTIENIEKEFDGIKNKVQSSGTNGALNQIGQAVISIATVIWKIFKGFMIFLLGLLVFAFCLAFVISIPAILLGSESFSLFGTNLNDTLPFFQSPGWVKFWSIGLVIATIFPLIILSVGLLYRLATNRRLPKNVYLVSLGVWIVGMGIIAHGFTRNISLFKTHEAAVSYVELEEQPDTIYLFAQPQQIEREAFKSVSLFGENIFRYAEQNNELYLRSIIDVEASNTNETQLKVRKVALNIPHDKQALADAAIQPQVNWVGDTMYVQQFYALTDPDIVKQNQRFTLKLPIGTTVFLSPSVSHFIYDVDNTTRMYDGDMIGKYWTMTEDGLACASCDDFEYNSAVRSNSDEISKIKVIGNFDVEIRQGNNFAVETLNTDDNVNIERKNGWVTIRKKNDYNILNNASTKVNVTVSDLSIIKAEGSTDIEVDKFVTDKLTIDVAGAADLDLNLQVEELDLEVSGAASVKLNGNAQEADYEVSGAAEIDTEQFEVRNCKLEMNGAGVSSVYCLDVLDAELNGAGTISYNKSVKEIQLEKNGFSIVKTY